MQTIPIQAIPNQTLTVTLDDTRYSLTFKEIDGSMAATISINDVRIISGFEIVAGGLLIPYRYLENGNFTFVTAEDAIPYYNEFGETQSLIYISQAELDAAR